MGATRRTWSSFLWTRGTGLKFSEERRKWTASYPFFIPPSELKDNYQQVKTYTERMEKRLIKQGRVEEFNSQFRDTVERGVFRELSEEELKGWKGPLNYIAMVEAFKNGPHATTTLRICMNSSLKQPPPVKKSLNDCLMKGPPALVDLFTITLSFREHRYALAKDLSKFYQKVEADELTQHMRRILWRDCDGSKEMRIYVTMTVNFGDRPAGCIAIAALRETAERYGADLPTAAWYLKYRTFVDDGWGRDLLPPDNAPGNQAGAQGGAAEPADSEQEVRLPEYRGWSQSTWNPGNGSGSGAVAPRGGCLGARPKTRGVAPSRGAPSTRGGAAQGGRPRGHNKESRDPPASQVRFGAAHPQVSRGARSRFKMVPPPKKRPSPSPSPAPGRGHWGWLRSCTGSRGQQRAVRMQPPRRPPPPDPGRVAGPLQLMGPGDHPMQRLALMMAVMMLGMPPVSGCGANVGPGNPGVGDQAGMTFPPSAWPGNSGETLATENKVSSATLHGNPPVEPGGFSVRRILQQIQQGMEGLEKITNEVLKAGQEAAKRNPGDGEHNPGSGESGQDNRPKREAAQKEMDVLKKGADATRGRGRRKGRVYQRAGIRN